MKRLFIAAVLAASLHGASLARDLELVEGAYEVELRHITMPGSTAGTAIFRTCDTCDPVSLRVTAATRYMIRNQALSLAEFRSAVDEIRGAAGGNAGTPVGVYYDLATGRLTRIAMFYDPR